MKKNRKNLVFAALCHDIGHAPFSHISEVFYPRERIISEICRLETLTESETEHLGKAANHELMSGLIVLKNARIRGILNSFHGDAKVVFKMICGLYDIDKESLSNCLVQIMHSSMDADRVDYILRDNISSGANIMALDERRLTGNYLIHKNLLRIKLQALSSVVNFVHGRSSIYEWIVNHHKNVLVTGVIRTYIDYLIKREESGKKVRGLRRGTDRFADYFTYKGIAEYLIDDIDLLSVFKSNKDVDNKTKIYYEHIFERKHFKPLWKTPLEFDKMFEKYEDYDGKAKVIGFKDNKLTTEYKRLMGLEGLIKKQFSALLEKNSETVFAFLCESRFYKDLPTDVKYYRINMYSKVRHMRNIEFCEASESRLYRHIDEFPYVYVRENLHNEYKDRIIRFLQRYPSC